MPCSAWHHGRHHPEAGGPSASCSCTLLTLLHPFSFRPSLYGAESAPSSDPQIGALTTKPFAPPGAQHSAMHCTLSAHVCYILRYTVCACAVFRSAFLRCTALPSAVLRSPPLHCAPLRCTALCSAPPRCTAPQVFGGSWGSTLALCYAIKHADKVQCSARGNSIHSMHARTLARTRGSPSVCLWIRSGPWAPALQCRVCRYLFILRPTHETKHAVTSLCASQ